MLAAVEPEIPVADRGVYEDAMMGLARARMGIRPEMAAADAHALQRNRLHLLQGPDELDLHEQQLRLLSRGKSGERASDL
ncbi:MAG TPA: hypothetical protein PK264_17360, partial [Hyphomicrobiaceae bacterium]|nr:hypothetical protein [Hyphomicrobiaceae bacterium]